MADARRKAELYATAAGLKLGRVVAVHEAGAASPRPEMAPRVMMSAAMPVARWVEFQTGVPYIEDLTLPRFQLDGEGMLRVPSGPGLGIELNPDALDRFARR